MTSRPAEAQHLCELARLHHVRVLIDPEYAEPLDVEALARGDGTFARLQAGNLIRIQEITNG